MSSLPESAAGYRRAVHMCVAAAESSTSEERARMLKDASDISLAAVKDMGEAYGASINTPCMAVFGIGILVPMILMSILPMLSVGGMFGVNIVDESTIVFITLGIIPAVILTISLWLRATNPFLTASLDKRELRYATPLLLAIPITIVYLSFGRGTEYLLLFALAPGCALVLALMFRDMGSERRRRKCEEGLRDSVFDMGNRMLSGDNFEKASAEAVAVRKECAAVADSLAREFTLCRGNIEKAVSRSIRPISEDVSIAFIDISRCARRDVSDAGRLAIALGRQFQNQNHARRSMELNLKSMTDMMLATAVLFAPLVLGMSVSMLEPLSKISEFHSLDGTATILSIYLAELSATIAVMMASLGRGEGFRSILWRFCIMCPLGQLVFCICCGIAIRSHSAKPESRGRAGSRSPFLYHGPSDVACLHGLAFNPRFSKRHS
ncbi:MAG: hypothetical protein IKQ60_10330 [Candidatus Methanomethylophilaceae archaeon]|nr:hypothetical protein [Candidatus Methanomethylophilaceae archaeon]